MKIRLQSNQYIKNCSTDKSYAIDFSKYGNKSMVFLPKKLTKFKEIEIMRGGSYWTSEYEIQFPDWLFDKMNESQKMTIDLILEQWKDDEVELIHKLEKERGA